MPAYRNKKTGEVVKTTCKVNGANWEQVQTKDQARTKSATKGKEEK